MLRLAFLLLVVVGVLALGVGTIFALGVFRLGMRQAAADPPTAQSPPTKPTAGPLVAAADAGPSTLPSIGPSTTPAPAAGGGKVPAVAAVADARPQLQAIVLRGADASLVGRNFRRLPEGDVGFWDRDKDYLTWTFTPEPGLYHVDVVTSGAAESGGRFTVSLGTAPSPGSVVEAAAGPGAGWGDFRTRRIGQLVLRGGRTTLRVQPAAGQSKPLMNFRRLELVPVGPGEKVTVAVHPNDMPAALEAIPADGPPTVTGLTLLDAATGKSLGALTTGMHLDLSSLPPISIRAETAGAVRSVQFLINGRAEKPPESEKPYSIAGERGAAYIPWRPTPGPCAIVVIPFRDPGGQGPSGTKFHVLVRTNSVAAIELSAKSAALNGGGLRVVGDPEPAVGGWTTLQSWVEWQATIPGNGKYRVEVLYACGPDGGGEMLVRAGDQEFVQPVVPTGGADAYKWATVGTATLKQGKTRVAIKSTAIKDGQSLMTLRSVRLVPFVDDED